MCGQAVHLDKERQFCMRKKRLSPWMTDCIKDCLLGNRIQEPTHAHACTHTELVKKMQCRLVDDDGGVPRHCSGNLPQSWQCIMEPWEIPGAATISIWKQCPMQNWKLLLLGLCSARSQLYHSVVQKSPTTEVNWKNKQQKTFYDSYIKNSSVR